MRSETEIRNMMAFAGLRFLKSFYTKDPEGATDMGLYYVMYYVMRWALGEACDPKLCDLFDKYATVGAEVTEEQKVKIDEVIANASREERPA